ncbi:MAG TPA: superoxide dismutase [Woeseiaceae bacterium]|nr:superoxide dismutase [Woeseiaceae bacterium]
MTIKLPELPYAMDALEPHISAKTMECHYGKHHRAYVDKLNKLIEGTQFEDLPLEQIIVSARDKAEIDILNNAAQAWNHTFFWQSLSPTGQSEPVGRIRDLIEDEFGGIDTFKKKFRAAATSQFGSGWTWLVLDSGKLRIMSTSNADSPIGTHMTPLLTLDVWEHAYYLDYQNERARYVDAFLDKLIDWRFALDNVQVGEKGEQQKKADPKSGVKAA